MFRRSGIAVFGCSLILVVSVLAVSGIAEPAPGTIQISSNPPGASVILDNRVVGTTPMTISGVPAGWHLIALPKTGYITWNSKPLVKMGAQMVIEATLIPKPDTTAVPSGQATPTLSPAVTKTPAPVKTTVVAPARTVTPTKTVSRTPAGTPAQTTTVAPVATRPEITDVTVTARGLAFDTQSITVPAGSPVRITLVNDDPDTLHNVAVYTDSSAKKPIFRGDTITGAARVTYRMFTAPQKPGTYFFRCDSHPSMTGRFIVR